MLAGVVSALVLMPGSAAATPQGEVVATGNSTPGFTSSNLMQITVGPDGNLWTVSQAPQKALRITPSGQVTEFTTGFLPGSNPSHLANGPDGKLWISAFRNTPGDPDRVYRMTTAGAIDDYRQSPLLGFPIAAGAGAITTGPDGNLWMTGFVNPGYLFKITPSFDFTEFQAGVVSNFTANLDPYDVTTGPDGNLWFTERNDPGRIGRITPAGAVTEFTAGLTPNSTPNSITAGPDGNLWFSEYQFPAGRIGRITPTGTITEFPADAGDPASIAAGPDGNLWFVTVDSTKIGRITTAGKVDLFPSNATVIGLNTIVAGPDGAMWFTLQNSPGQIGRIFPGPAVKTGGASAIGQSSVTLAASIRPNGQPTSFKFDLGETTAYGKQSDPGSAGSGTEFLPGLRFVTGLKPSTTYHYRAQASNDADSALGDDATFTTATALSAVKAQPRRFRVNRRGPAEKVVTAKRRKPASKGTKLKFTLSGDARVVVSLERKVTGKKKGKKRKKASYVAVGKFAVQGSRGPNIKKFSGRLGKKALKAGSYRATLIAIDKAGIRGDSKQLSFTVVRRYTRRTAVIPAARPTSHRQGLSASLARVLEIERHLETARSAARRAPQPLGLLFGNVTLSSSFRAGVLAISAIRAAVKIVPGSLACIDHDAIADMRTPTRTGDPMPVDPTPEDVQKLLQEDPGGPVVMLNLLRYDPDGGRERYAEYAPRRRRTCERVGGELLYAGDCSTALVTPEGFNWDTMLVVRYPSRQAFLDMVADPEYLEISKIRTGALAEAVLQATNALGRALRQECLKSGRSFKP